MKILDIKELAIPEIKVIKFARFHDMRGYFVEQFKKSDILNSKIDSLKNVEFVQANQSYSKKGTIRGIHFQWNPYMGKLRTLSGNMVDLVLDIRKGSPDFGKIIGYEMPASDKRNHDEWIWIPPGFAHGNFFTKNSKIEYMCSGEYSPGCESGVSPLAKDIDWSLCDKNIKKKFDKIAYTTELITDKDKNGFSLEDWTKDKRSNEFIYKELKKKVCAKMFLEEKTLFTGGNGLLGKEMKKLIPGAYFPSHEEFDITGYPKMENYLQNKNIETLIHAAALTSPPIVNKSPMEAIDTNIIGTSNIVKLCNSNGIKLVYLSTDYVFKGDKGNYKEDDEVFPVNKYAWSKLGGECAVRMYDNSLIIRTSFGPNEFPFPKAFVDQWTSRESVSVIAKKIVNLLYKDIKGTIHIGGTRKTVFEYAKSLDSSKEIEKLSINEVPFKVPRDSSLNCEKYNKLMEGEKINKMKKILVAGGAGYVGSSLVPALQERKYEVDVVDLLWFGNHLPEKTNLIQKDIFDLKEEDLKDYEQVIFLAGLSNDPMADYSPKKNFIYNAALPAYLAHRARKAGVKRYIYASSCSIYGYTGDELYNEEDEVTCDYPYGISKLQGENGCMQLKNDNFSVIALRQGTYAGFSPRMRTDVVVNSMFKTAMLEKKITVNNPSIWRPILDMRDGINAYLRAIQADYKISGAFNVASENYTVGHIADLVKEEMEKKIKKKVSLDIKDIQDFRNYKVSLEKAKIRLGFIPNYTIKDTIDHLYENLDSIGDLGNPDYQNINMFKKLE